MRKRLMVGLLSAGLVAAMLPGMASAAGGKGASFCSRATGGDNPGDVVKGALGVPPGPTDPSTTDFPQIQTLGSYISWLCNPTSPE